MDGALQYTSGLLTGVQIQRRSQTSSEDSHLGLPSSSVYSAWTFLLNVIYDLTTHVL